MHTTKIQKSINLASYLHRDQTRKGKPPLPYISHVIAVALIVSEFTKNEDVICAAFLHDVLEDIDSSIYGKKEMIADFGNVVYEIVYGVTEDAKIQRWRVRKDKYLSHLHIVNIDSQLVSVADKLHNLQSLIEEHKKVGSNLWGHFPFNAQDNIWYHRSVLEITRNKLSKKIISRYEKLIIAAEEEYGL